MLELKDDEDTQPSMNQDMTKFLHLCCVKGLTFDIYDVANIVIRDADQVYLNLEFSDLYYPKNLLRTLKEKLDEKEKTSLLHTAV